MTLKFTEDVKMHLRDRKLRDVWSYMWNNTERNLFCSTQKSLNGKIRSNASFVFTIKAGNVYEAT